MSFLLRTCPIRVQRLTQGDPRRGPTGSQARRSSERGGPLVLLLGGRAALQEAAHEALHGAPDLIPRRLWILRGGHEKRRLQQRTVDQAGKRPDRLRLHEALRDERLEPLLDLAHRVSRVYLAPLPSEHRGPVEKERPPHLGAEAGANEAAFPRHYGLRKFGLRAFRRLDLLVYLALHLVDHRPEEVLLVLVVVVERPARHPRAAHDLLGRRLVVSL